MRIRGCTIEYNLNEAAKMLKISPDDLRCEVEEGRLRYYYRLKSKDYRFHDASILTNRELLAQGIFTTRRKLPHHPENIR